MVVFGSKQLHSIELQSMTIERQYSGTSDRDDLALYKGHLLRHHANMLVYYFTSEIGTTSLHGTKLLAPKCPLFGNSTVYHTTTSE